MLVISVVLVSYTCGQKGELYVILGHKRLLCVPYGFIMRRKYFAGNLLSLTMNIFDKSMCKKHSLEALELVDKPSNVIY